MMVIFEKEFNKTHTSISEYALKNNKFKRKSKFLNHMFSIELPILIFFF